MPFLEKLDVLEEGILKYNAALLNILLKDRTTEKNIIWATSDYSYLGERFAPTDQILPSVITGRHSKVIQPRSAKALEKQILRTREKAEVFTPSWICNAQNNLIDDEWFGHSGSFNTELSNSWTVNPKKISFPKDKRRDWKNYVDARRLEIACGEAPYLVSRYDTVTAEIIDLPSRIGLLDRKLRVVNENASDEKEWLKWAFRAFESIYGFEYQGDNLLIARENLLYTFIDNLRYVLKRDPTINELQKIATIISWNLWQMDGTTYRPPLYALQRQGYQASIFDSYEETEMKILCLESTPCKIKDWRTKEIVQYYSLIKGYK
ncbi:MAG TPA: restriction endonuclease subunit M [Candidatus Avisuccinivibrio pullicola]|nr:restriction endonuclease subunit M [Candidatus Avisuccinivibrio pullicola]